MPVPYHVLNGDALSAQFPEGIEGERIVARECLVDGPVGGKDLDTFFQTRAAFLNEAYGDSAMEDYLSGTVSEFQKIMGLPKGALLCLWFEDDLFCQVNFWFVCWLIHQYTNEVEVFLIRPEGALQYGFGGLGQAALKEAYHNRQAITDVASIAALWIFYCNGDTQSLLESGKKLERTYPFILPAIEAHLERLPSKDSPGRPVTSLKAIINDLNTTEFGPVFRAFNERESIYGYGDLQVKHLFDKIIAGQI